MELNHFDENGRARMVDVSGKAKTSRRALARGTIRVSREIFAAITAGTAAKGDVLAVATVAGVTAAKRTWELIPMCHAIPLGSCNVRFETREAGSGAEQADTAEAAEAACEICCECEVKTEAQTGVEMEALTAVSVALLTIYDMCKGIDKDMEIGDIHLVEKSGGKSGRIVNARYMMR